MQRLLILVLLTTACGDDEAGTPGTDFTCHRSDRTGTYLTRFVERSGNCGPIPDTVGRLDSAMASSPSVTCVETAPDRWSLGDCKLERSYRCVGADGSVADFTAVSTQQDAAGSRITGIATATLSGPGVATCTSTYDVESIRQ